MNNHLQIRTCNWKKNESIQSDKTFGYPRYVSDFLFAAAKSLQSCPTLCDPTDSSPPGSSVPGNLQTRTLERAAISFSNACMHAMLLQSCPTLCDPMDSSPPGSSVHGILQARILDWVAISFSRFSIQLQIYLKQKRAWTLNNTYTLHMQKEFILIF